MTHPTHPQTDLDAGILWMGDLSGFEVNHRPGHDVDALAVIHRCGWRVDMHPADSYLGNLTAAALQHRQEGCLPMLPSAAGSYLADLVRRSGL